MIDRYLLKISYSPLVISAIVCAFASVLLSMIPKHWLQTIEKTKPTFNLLHKDSTATNNIMAATAGATTLDEIRAQRRLRNALLFNEGKT